MSSKAVIAVNRFGYGAKPGEIEAAQANPQQWLINQLSPIVFDKSQPDSNQVMADVRDLRRQLQQDKSDGKEQDKTSRRQYQRMVRTLSSDSIRQSISASNSMAWRLLEFFSNHFSVSGTNLFMKALAPTLEREAIAPNLYGKFEEMLVAVTAHPAMIVYLNNEQSFGPNSRIATRKKNKKKRGLNENLAREILELHTLGVDGGYTQKDVTEFSKALTGWSIKRRQESGEGFVFRANGHEPGSVIVLDKTYRDKGVKQAVEILVDLARSPVTAKFVSTKLVKHFISDSPDPELVSTLVDEWIRTDGNIRRVMTALINAKESWLEQPRKFKTPREYYISVNRALGRKTVRDQAIFQFLNSMGQLPFNAGSPAGYSDDRLDWDSSSALMKKIDWSMMVSSAVRTDIRQTIDTVFAGELSELTYKTVTRAESKQVAYSLLFMSPEFLGR